MENGDFRDLLPKSWLGYMPYCLIALLGAAVAYGTQLRKLGTSIATFLVDFVTAGVVIRKKLDDSDARMNRLESEMASLMQSMRTIATNAGGEDGGPTTRQLLQAILDAAALSAARLEVVTDADKVARFECGPDGACTAANKALCTLFGRLPNEITGNGWVEAMHPDDRREAFAAWHESVLNDLPYEYRYRVVTPSSSGVYVSAKAKAVRRPDKSVIAFLGTVTPAAA